MYVAFTLGATVPALADFDAGVTAFRQEDYATALREFEACGTAKAKFYLSLMYSMGWGVPQNKKKSVALMRLAKEQELAEKRPVLAQK